MPPETQTLPQEAQPAPHRLLVGAVVIALLFLCAAAFFLHPDFVRKLLGSFGKQNSSSASGTISVVLQAGGLRTPYNLDVATKSLAPVANEGNDVLLNAVISPDASAEAYVCRDSQKRVQVCLTQRAVHNRVQLTNDAYESKRGLRWSRDGKQILFTARMKQSEEDRPYSPEDWGVFMVGVEDRKTNFIATGTTPFFAPDSRTVYYLGKNGLYGVVLATGALSLVWPLEGGEAHRFMALAVSPSGSHIAWTNVLADGWKGNLSLFEVKSWHPFSMAQKTRIALPAVQAVFSPDSESLVFNTAPNPASGEAPAIYVLKLEEEPERIFNLQAYDRETVISDWR